MRQSPANSLLASVILVALASTALASTPAMAQGALKPIAPAAHAFDGPRKLQLEIIVNDEALKLFEPFVHDVASNRFQAKRSDLEEIGIRTPPGEPDEMVFLDRLGVTYRYYESLQRMEFALTDDQRLPKVYNAMNGSARVTPHADFGASLNYSLFGGSIRDMNAGKFEFTGANAWLDARVFSDYGLVQQTGVVGRTLIDNDANVLRLDSTYTFASPETTITYRVGDTLSGATAWTRRVRMAGVQMARDFTLRSDIVTRPLPVISGTAAAPSTVDVIVNGLKTYSQPVGSGPFSVTNLPVMGAGGDARVLIRDATGRTFEMSLSLFNTANMLAPGLSDFSLEAGLARRNYGALSNDYFEKPIASSTYRYGFNRWLTAETHAEAGAGLVNVGGGALVGFGSFGTANIGIAASRTPGGSGGQIYGDYQVQWQGATFSIGTQRTLGDYDDLASVTANYNNNPALTQTGPYGVVPLRAINTYASPRPPRALDRVSIATRLFEKSTISFGAINLVQQDGAVSRLLTASFTRTLPWKQATLYATSFADFGTRKNIGVTGGISFALSGVNASVGAVSDRQNGGALTADISKNQEAVDNTGGWRVRGGAGGQNMFGQADGSYRTSVGQLQASAMQSKYNTTVTGQFDGSIAFVGGAPTFGNKITSGFAVVDAGAAGVPITQDNRVLGVTGPSGRYLVSNLRTWEGNSVGIDATNMPVAFDATTTSETIAPRDKSGVYVRFGEQKKSRAAVVIFKDAAGKPLGVGSRGHIEGQSDSFLVGYDGRAYIRDLASTNVALLDLGDRDCRASFDYEPEDGRQGLVKGVVCQ
jgi:outer membrane usher protein